MLKKLLLGFGLAAGLLSPAHSAGTIPFSLSQQLDSFGKPLANCFFYTVQAGTTSTPQSAYQDSGLTIALPNPQRCDASGRLPQFFLADGSIKVRLTDANGITQVIADGILVIGPSGGGGGGSTVDPTTILSTGDLKVTYGTGVLSGFVRANGRTIGSASSGASERANADTSALYAFLWNADPNLVVSTGRGANAAADFAANKTIALPDWRGRALAGLDDMGNSAAGRLTATYFGSAATVLGAAGGSESKSVLQANFPAVNFAVTGNVNVTASGIGALGVINGSAATGLGGTAATNVYSTATYAQLLATFSAGLAASGGSGTPLAVASPMMLATIYLKL